MLKPGERISLIKQLAERLGQMSYDEIDLHLRQFGLPWQARWSGSPHSYVLRMLEDAKDAGLLALHEHLFGFSGAPTREPSFWIPGWFRLFISHVSTNKVQASALSAACRAYAISGFVAHEHIQPSREWLEEIETALLTCDALVALLSPGFKESDWTDQEVGFCHGRKVLIISVRCGLDPYGSVARYQAVHGKDRPVEDIAHDIYKILVQHPKTSARLAEALVTAFQNSDSYAEAKQRVALLADVQNWTPDLLRRIETAVESNSQVRNAWGVPV